MREHYLFRQSEQPDPQVIVPPADRLRSLVKTAVLSILVTIILVWIALYFKGYSENRPKNEIELIFEKGFSEYLKKIGREPGK